MKIALIAPVLPPQLNGVGDYTALLARELSKTHPIQIWTGQNTPFEPILDVGIEPVFRVGDARSFRALEGLAKREKPDWIVLQSSGFGYGPRGLNLELPRTLRRIVKNGDARLALMIHEPFVRATDLKTALMGLWQGWQFRSLGRTSRAIFYSIEAWKTEFEGFFKGRLNVHLPVFSNLPFHAVGREIARQGLNLSDSDFVLGLFGTAHEARLLHRVADAARAVEKANLRPVVLYIGPHGARVRAALPDLRILDQGALEPGAISARFAAMDIYLSAFSDGISTRRGSLMAALQHGVPTVGTSGHLTDSLWKNEDGRAIALAPVESGAAFERKVAELTQDTALRTQLGLAGQRLYEREFSLSVTARRLMESLKSLS